MNRLGIAARAVALAALFLGAAAAAHGTSAPEVVTLRNGLRVMLAPDSTSTAVDVGVWYPAGTRWESPGMLGVSHLLERLMFRGSAHVPDGAYLREVFAEGAVANTTTTPDGSCYWQTLPAEALAHALRLESDRMAGLNTSPAAFEAERRGARDDRRARAAPTPIARGLARLVALAFAGSGYDRSPYGEDADLARMTAGQVESWRRGHFGAGGAVLTIVGRFEPQGTLRLVRSLFESLPRGTTPAAPRPVAALPGRRGWDRGETPLRIVYAGWRGPGATDPDAPAVELMAAAMAADSSRFQSALLRDWHAAVVTQSRSEVHRDASLLWVAAALDVGMDSSTTERVMLDEVARLAREPLPADRFEHARARLVTDELFRRQTVRARAFAWGEALQQTGDAAAADRRLEALDRLTPADVQRVAQKVVTDSARSVFWYVPAGEGR